jgi:transposase
LAEESGLRFMLQETFPLQYKQILRVAFFIVTQGDVLSNINLWNIPNIFHLGNSIDDKRASDLFSSLNFSAREAFLQKWINKHYENDYIVYDVTPLQTYSKCISKVAPGCHGKHINIPQFNMGMFYGQLQRLPLYYHTYNGSNNDKTDFITVINRALALGLKKVIFIIDKGFLSDDNLKQLIKVNYDFIIPLTRDRILYRNLIQKHRNEIRDYMNIIDGYMMFGKAYPCKIADINLYAHIFYDHERALMDDRELRSEIEGNENSLESLTTQQGISRKYARYHSIQFSKNVGQTNVLNFSKNYEKINSQMGYSGFMILITSKNVISASSLINIYKDRDTIEKSFEVYKNDLEFGKIRTQNDNTTEGKLFIGFISHILRSIFQNKLKNDKDTKTIPIGKALNELNQYTLFCYDNKPFFNSLSKKSKVIFRAIGIHEPNALINSISERHGNQ